jgi:uncharacterized protein YodC (DUF2158 family)
MNTTLKAGDTVQLRSGGLVMTIEEIKNYGADHARAQCEWFEGVKRQSGVFELSSLKNVALELEPTE